MRGLGGKWRDCIKGRNDKKGRRKEEGKLDIAKQTQTNQCVIKISHTHQLYTHT